MRQIRLGLEAGLDVSSYSKLIYSAVDMLEMRQNIMNGTASGASSEENRKMGKNQAQDPVRKKNLSFLLRITEIKRMPLYPGFPAT